MPRVKRIKVNISLKTGKELEVLGDQLSQFYAITPYVEKDGSITKTRKCTITHIPSGMKTYTYKNKKTAKAIWDNIKHLDIHYTNPQEVYTSKDFQILENNSAKEAIW